MSTYDYELPEIEGFTDDSGHVEFNNLLTAVYDIKLKGIIKQPHYNDPDSLVNVPLLGYATVLPEAKVNVDTIYAISSGTQPGLKINELYTVGPPNNFFYFFDQYIELYNSSDETKYLDGHDGWGP